MKKLRNSIAFKTVMIILFVASLLVCAVSGLISIRLYAEHGLTKRGKENLKQSIITRIAYDDYNNRAVSYYENYLNGWDCAQDKNFFSEDNTNYSFRAKITGSDRDYDELVSYVPKDYQYSQTDTYVINTESYTETKYVKVSPEKITSTTPYVRISHKDLSALGWFDSDYEDTLDNIIKSESGNYYLNADIAVELYEKYYRDNGHSYSEEISIDIDDESDDEYLDDPEEEYYDSETEFDEESYDEDSYDEGALYNYYDDTPYINMVTDGTFYYVLDNLDVVSDYINEFFDKNVNFTIEYDLSYDSDASELCIDAYINCVEQMELDWYVKSDLTAYDGFYNSITLRYLDEMSAYAIPVCVFSGIVFLICFIILIVVSGHKCIKIENEDGSVEVKDEIKLGIFDKIPYDIVLVLVMLPLFFGIESLSNAYYGSIESIIAAVCAVTCSFLGAYLVMTTSARLKCDGWRFLKKTIVFMLAGMVLKILKAIFFKIGSGIKFLWKHINLYWKHLLIILGVLAVELFFTMHEDAPMTFLVLLFEKAAVMVFAAYALINISKIKNYTKSLAEGNTDDELSTEHMHGEFLDYAKDLGHVNDGIKAAVENQMKSEMMRTELITNVSHDIKTPLTSIINYVDLLGKENIENEKAQEYLEVLNRQSQRLKKLIIDLIDASKASTGNVEVNLEKLDLSIILTQLNGEYEEQFEAKKLKLVTTNKAADTHIMADGRQIYRVFDNLFVNVKKYAQENTRVYIDITDEGDKLGVSLKNISKEELNISGEELMERFTRGDRSRNTEGSGLGLSIAKSLIELQNGQINIVVDGDLYKVELMIPKA